VAHKSPGKHRILIQSLVHGGFQANGISVSLMVTIVLGFIASLLFLQILEVFFLLRTELKPLRIRSSR
jgi:hypothetical protein